jgi:hypothetical protein
MRDKTLARISSVQAKRFLTELANLNDDAVERFHKRFGALVPHYYRELSPGEYLSVDEDFKTIDEEMLKVYEEDRILELRDLVRQIWVEPDLRTKRYGVFLLWKWSLFSLMGGERNIPSRLPPPNPFEQIIQVLIDAADLAHYCGNPECFTPYFFALRRNQKYCSDACAKPAQREFKRQWWAEHGEEWRASRKPKKSTQRSQSKTKAGKRSKKPMK